MADDTYLHISPSGPTEGAIQGTPPSDDDKCPKCGSPTMFGYGFAFGSGIGPYWSCEKPECDWFHKISEPHDMG